MAPKLHPKRKIASLPSSDLIEFGSPDIFYDTQKAFQDQGVTLIDLDTGQPINGQVNISDIGMIEPGKPLKVIHQMGFVQPSSENDLDYVKTDIDAVLVFDQSSQRPGEPFYLLIQVVEHDDVDLWTEICLAVARKFVVKSQGNLSPKVIFGITSLSRGLALDSSARNTALRKIRSYTLDAIDSISDSALIPEDDSLEDDEADPDDEDTPEC